jgi:peptidoglycan/xylan/chitin deacetylase (PgdA/CDA1 family)
MLIDLGLRLARQAAGAQRLTILTFHRVLAEPDPLLPGEPDAVRFRRQLEFLVRYCAVLPLPEAVARLARRDLPPGAVAVTFDDGYANNCEVALPILRDLGVPATVFVATALLDGGLMFNDALLELVRRAPGEDLDLRVEGLGRLPLGPAPQRRATWAALVDAIKYRAADERLACARRLAAANGVELPDELMLTTAQLRALHAAGIDIGGHTCSHPILARLPAAAAEAEIAGSHATLARLLGTPPVSFAYPNGVPGRDFGPEHVAMVRAAGYRLACATTRGCADPAADPFALPRTTLWARDRSGLARNLASIYVDAFRQRLGAA